jgi:hypothetical protein
MESAMVRKERAVPAGAAAARARAKESSTAAWELKGKATTAMCGGGGGAIVLCFG